jgi:hypothetical protein
VIDCGAPHGGLFGPYCPDCNKKSQNPANGIPPNPGLPDEEDEPLPNLDDPAPMQVPQLPWWLLWLEGIFADRSIMTNPQRFVLEAIDPVTECVAFDAVFEVKKPQELCTHLQIAAGDFDPHADYELDESDVGHITGFFKVEFDPGAFRVNMRSWRPSDELPYKIHTNRELYLMLKGTKPLAAFVDEYPPNPECEVIPERCFEPYVRSGRFLKHEHIYSEFDATGKELKFRRVLYALPEEKWRIPAYILLWKTAEKSGWNEGFERMEGSLLGYEDWQNDAHMEMRRRVGRG